MSSNSVGSRLMITSVAPLRLAISGNPAAGHTTSDEPIGEEKIARQRQLLGAPHRLLGHRLSERHRRGLDVTAAVRAIGRLAADARRTALDPAKLVALGAVEAGRIGRVAVQLDHVRRPRNAGGLVQVVDVLRDHARRPCRRGRGSRAHGARGPAARRRTGPPWRSAAARLRRASPGWRRTRRTGSAASWSRCRPASGSRGCRIRSRCRRR